MKKLIFSAILLATSFQVAQAKIWTVNNALGATADFTTTQAAHNGASAGDTIQVEGSITSYAGVTCTKPLIWIGPGYFLSENAETQYNKDSTEVSSFTFNTGSGGTMIMGFYSSVDYINTNNITIMRCYQPQIYLGYSAGPTDTGIVIEQNYNCYLYNSTTYSACTGMQIFSNYISSLNLPNTSSSATIYSNVITSLNNINNCLMEDNIIQADTVTFAANNVFHYDILYNGSLNTSPNGNGNFYVSNFSTIFVNWNDATALDDNLELSGSSPAKEAGMGGIDLGMFGGPTPYILSGIPAVPSIYALTAPNTVASGSSSMSVTVSIKSHN